MMRQKSGIFGGIFVCCLMVASPAWGFGEYLRNYNIGIDYLNSNDQLRMSYEVPNSIPAGCETSINNANNQRCSQTLQAGSSSGFGLFIQQPFQRQGFFYFNYDLGMALRYLNGSATEEDILLSKSKGLPLTEASFSLLAFLLKPYIQIGITPASSWPDIIFTIGPSVQLAAGYVSINKERENTAVISRGGIQLLAEMEVVLWRFGEGAFSLYTSTDNSGGEEDATDFYPHAKDGMSDFKAEYARHVGGAAYGFGLKLLLNWP